MKRALMSLAAVTLVTGALLLSTTTGASPVGYTMMSLSGSSNLYTLDVATGATAAVGDTTRQGVRGLTFAPDGTLYASSSGTLVAIDPATAATTTIGGHGCCGLISDMTFDASGDLWLTSGSPSSLYAVDPATGAGTLVGSLDGRFVSGLAADCTGALYGIDHAGDVLVTIDTTDADTTVVGSLGVDIGGGGADVDASETLWLLDRTNVSAAPSRTYTVDTATGLATLVAPAVSGNNPSDLGLAPLDCEGVPVTTSTTTTTEVTEPTTTTSADTGPDPDDDPAATSTTPPSADAIGVAPAATPVAVPPAFTG